MIEYERKNVIDAYLRLHPEICKDDYDFEVKNLLESETVDSSSENIIRLQADFLIQKTKKKKPLLEILKEIHALRRLLGEMRRHENE